MISLDTTRADALSMYGARHPTTPNLDALAGNGTRFAWALSPASSTLSSHATVFTGLDPHGTQIVRNGYPLRPEVETLAERLSGAGYDTIGVLGSSALAKPMGIDQGFRIWNQKFSEKRAQRNEARAEEVTTRALTTLGKRQAGKPVFLFVHYFDAHSPYAAPAPWTHKWSEPGEGVDFGTKDGALNGLANAVRDGTADPADLRALHDNYLSEVSYVDSEVKRLLDGIDLSRTVVVVFGDHGEAFGEIRIRPFGHGMDLEMFETHVPLFLAGPGVPSGKVVDTPVGLIDVSATALNLLGIASNIGDSIDVSALWSDTPAVWDRTWFLEATVPELKRGPPTWNNLGVERGVAKDGYLLLRSPFEDDVPRLYKIAQGQPAVQDDARRDAMTQLLTDWDAKAPPHREDQRSKETRAGLKALGYEE